MDLTDEARRRLDALPRVSGTLTGHFSCVACGFPPHPGTPCIDAPDVPAQPGPRPAEPGDPGYRERVMQALGVPLSQFTIGATPEQDVSLYCTACGAWPLNDRPSMLVTLNELVAAAVDHRSGPRACTP